MNTIQKLFKTSKGPCRPHIFSPFELLQFTLGKEKKNPTKLTLYSKVSRIRELFHHFVCSPGFSKVSFSCGFVLVLLISASPKEGAGAEKKR